MLQTKMPLRFTKENKTIPVYKQREAMHHTTANRHLGQSAKRNGTQRRKKVSPLCMQCTCFNMPKATSLVEVTSNSEKIKLVAELCLPGR